MRAPVIQSPAHFAGILDRELRDEARDPKTGYALNESGRVAASEPTLRQKAAETLRHLSAAHTELDETEAALAGPFPSQEGKVEAEVYSLEHLLMLTSQSAACLVGRLATLNAKI